MRDRAEGARGTPDAANLGQYTMCTGCVCVSEMDKQHTLRTPGRELCRPVSAEDARVYDEFRSQIGIEIKGAPLFLWKDSQKEMQALLLLLQSVSLSLSLSLSLSPLSLLPSSLFNIPWRRRRDERRSDI